VSDAVTLTLRQYRIEQKLFWRNPSSAFFNFLLPLLILFMFGAIFHGKQKDLNVIVPGIAGMSVLATTFTALSYNMTFLREQGVLKRMRGTPLPAGCYLGGVALNAITNTIIQLTIVVLSGHFLFGLHWPRDLVELIVFVAAGVICFAALGVAFAHLIPNFDSAPAYVNAVFLPLVFISGVFYDVKNTPAFLRDIAQALPLKHVIDGLSGAMVSGRGIGVNASSLGVIGLWAVLGAFFAVRGFTWEQRRE
jgi:ABC-2 type transport system permease protein